VQYLQYADLVLLPQQGPLLRVDLLHQPDNLIPVGLLHKQDAIAIQMAPTLLKDVCIGHHTVNLNQEDLMFTIIQEELIVIPPDLRVRVDDQQHPLQEVPQEVAHLELLPEVIALVLQDLPPEAAVHLQVHLAAVEAVEVVEVAIPAEVVTEDKFLYLPEFSVEKLLKEEFQHNLVSL
jgi:hypothetical protein